MLYKVKYTSHKRASTITPFYMGSSYIHRLIKQTVSAGLRGWGGKWGVIPSRYRVPMGRKYESVFCHPPPYLQREGLSLRLTDCLGWPANELPGFCCHYVSVLGLQVCTAMRCSYMGTGDLNSSPHACAAKRIFSLQENEE